MAFRRPSATPMTTWPTWPTCSSCRHGDPDSVCHFTPRHPYRRPPADLAQDGSCGYWHSIEGQTRRARCREVNRRLDFTRPPLRSETIRGVLPKLLDELDAVSE